MTATAIAIPLASHPAEEERHLTGALSSVSDAKAALQPKTSGGVRLRGPVSREEDEVARRVFVFLLGVSLGYCTGFSDAKRHEHNVLVRAVERVRGVARNTVGARGRSLKKTAEELEREPPPQPPRETQ